MWPLLLKVGLAAFTVSAIVDALTEEKKEMFDHSKKVQRFHDEKVLLDKAMKDKLRTRRDSNRKKVRDNLEDLKTPKFHRQGSIAMGTIIQCKDDGLDIDDGIYFQTQDLKKDDGSEYTPSEIKQRIKKAVSDPQFNKKPEIKTSCVRVFYAEGYHIDLPSYRKLADGSYELAGETWTKSDPKAVTNWFIDAVKAQSPKDSSDQLKEIVRLLKKFGKRWSDAPSGFIVTALCVEGCYKANASRIDVAIYDTMKGIHDRLVNKGLEVDHPVVAGQKLTKGVSDPKMQKFKERLKSALDDLAVLFEDGCTEKKANAAWGKVFGEKDYFEASLEAKASADAQGRLAAQVEKDAGLVATLAAAPSILKPKAAEALQNRADEIDAVKKRGGGEGYGFG